MALTTQDIARLRLAAQCLVGEPCADAVETVRRLTCIQAQDLPGAVTSVALRTAGGGPEAVHAAMDAGEVVRSWPMRGTLHLLAAEDLSWMLALTTERLVAQAASRRSALGLTEALIETARESAVVALDGGRRLRRTELMALWEQAGLLGVRQRGYHLLWHISQTGTVCLGPWSDGEQDIVLLSEWVREPRRLERDEALGEWALRYFTSHGPATAKDFAWWTKLLAGDVRTAVALARPSLVVVPADGVEYLMHPATHDRLAAAGGAEHGVLLLPGFDEFLLGYQDRSAALPARFAERIVPGRNGVFQPTVVLDGQVVGTWKRVGTGTRRHVESSAFEPWPDGVADAVQARAAALSSVEPAPSPVRDRPATRRRRTGSPGHRAAGSPAGPRPPG